MTLALVYIIFTYLFSSISMAKIIGAFKNVDLNDEGTGNPGATNVYRTIGPGWGIITGVFDFLKGYLPVYIARSFFLFSGPVLVLISLVAIIGHNWPIYYGFNGGRGLATTLGTMGALSLFYGLVSFTMGGSLAWFFTSKLDREIRIPYLAYPLYLLLVFVTKGDAYLIYYGIAIMVLVYFRAWQVNDR